MSKTLYLLRQPVEHINRAVFVPSETEGDVVLLEDSGSTAFSHQTGKLFSLQEGGQGETISYDALIEKIFQSDRTIVV